MSRIVALLGGVSLLGAALLRWALLVVTVEGQSMEPTLSAGSRVLVRRCRPAALRRGAVVVVAPPADALATWRGAGPSDPTLQRLVKRVVALPGDAVPAAVREAAPATWPAEVAAGRLVALGDNASRSLDSRQLGPFRTRDVLGVVVRTLDVGTDRP